MPILDILHSHELGQLAKLERAAQAVARGDAAVRFAPDGVAGLAKLRVAVGPADAGLEGMIALLRGEGERTQELELFRGALRVGMTRARGGIVPTLATLSASLGEPSPVEQVKEMDGLLRGADDALSPLLRAAIAAGALRQLGASAEMATLAATWTLCVNGAIGDGWLTVAEPVALPSEGALDEWLPAVIANYARDGRELERAATLGAEIIGRDETRIRELLGRAHFSALDVLGVLRRDGAINVPDVAVALGISVPTAGAAVERLVELGIAREITGRARSRVFVYAALVEALAPAAR